jgi:hypothetical protein
MLVAMIVSGIVGGQLISRTGRYKILLLAGLFVMGAGFFILSTLGAGASNREAIEAMVLIGTGLGLSMQTYVLMVQNSVSGHDMAVATSTTQLSRSIGSAVGLAILGTVLSQGMASAMAKYVPAAALKKLEASGGGATATAVFDPSQLVHLPGPVAIAIRHALADALHPVFVAGLVIVAGTFLATLFIHELPLRQTAHVAPGRRPNLSEPQAE